MSARLRKCLNINVLKNRIKSIDMICKLNYGIPMIDPTNITKFNRTEAELEEFLLFCILVAGKNSNVQAKKLEKFLTDYSDRPMDPFTLIRYLIFMGQSALMSWMKMSKLGQYTRLEKCFTELMFLQGKLSTCSVSDLEAISGIGPKTARFFLTHTRPNQQFAVLDTHMLRYLRDMGYDKVPASTPSGKKYREWELVVLDKALSHGMSAADFDLMIWNKYSKNGKK